MLAVKAGALYCAILFAVGMLLGPIRVMLVSPRGGEAIGVAVEAPFLLVAMVFATRWVVAHLGVPATPGARLGMGAVALALQQLGDLAVAFLLRGMSWQDYLAAFTGLRGAIYVALLAAFFLMPVLLARGQGTARG
ncbi:MAG: hypothetical protein IT557_05465 [Alphaproteobacteria bacterium]|nr:hypothetical protein [Alphaproteobacteria bacterium]